MDKSAFPLPFYSALMQDSVKASFTDVQDISEDFLTTVEGNEYFRWKIADTQKGVLYYQVLYMYESGDRKLVITYTRPAGTLGEEYDAVVDDAMTTVQFTHKP